MPQKQRKGAEPTRQIISFLSLVLLGPPTSFAAQEVPSLAPGERVRVSVPWRAISASGLGTDRVVKTGTVVALNVDAFTLKAEGQSAPLMIPLDSVTEFDAQRPDQRGRGAAKGAIIGFLIGGAVGALAAIPVYTSVAGAGLAAPSGDDVNTGKVVAAGALGGAVLGLVIGSAIGAARGSERWQRAPLPGRLTVAPQRRGGARLAASVNF